MQTKYLCVLIIRLRIGSPRGELLVFSITDFSREYASFQINLVAQLYLSFTDRFANSFSIEYTSFQIILAVQFYLSLTDGFTDRGEKWVSSNIGFTTRYTRIRVPLLTQFNSSLTYRLTKRGE